MRGRPQLTLRVKVQRKIERLQAEILVLNKKLEGRFEDEKEVAHEEKSEKAEG
jgi:hypothetical protein